MTKTQQALKLALEALESCSAGDYSTGHVIHPSFDVDAVNRAIDAVDEALADHIRDATKMVEPPSQHCWLCGDMDEAYQAKCTVPACGMKEQVEQKRPQNCGTGYCSCIECLFEQPAQNPDESKCPLCYNDPSNIKQPAQPQQDFSDAYQGAREDLAIWKKRTLEAEALNRKFIADINGQTFMGEPLQQQEPVAWLIEFENGEQELHFEDQSVGETHIPLYTSPPASKPWIGLTKADKKEIERVAVYVDGAIRLTEAKLKEKNA